MQISDQLLSKATGGSAVLKRQQLFRYVLPRGRTPANNCGVSYMKAMILIIAGESAIPVFENAPMGLEAQVSEIDGTEKIVSGWAQPGIFKRTRSVPTPHALNAPSATEAVSHHER